MNLLELGLKIGVEGFLHCNELDKLVELAANRDVLEVGSFKGLSAWGMAISARTLTCVDTFKANSAGQFQLSNLTTLDDFKKATARFNNVAHFVGSSQEASATFTVGVTWDMIFLDAMHTYEDVKADIDRWWPRVWPGGLMAFHDYGHHDFPGVKKAVDERFPAVDGTVITLAWIVKPAA